MGDVGAVVDDDAALEVVVAASVGGVAASVVCGAPELHEAAAMAATTSIAVTRPLRRVAVLTPQS